VNRLRNSVLPGLALFIVVCTPIVVYGQHKAEQKTTTNVDEFSYSAQDRRDPFEPVYLTRMTKKVASGTAQKSGYELEELKLVGVIKTGAVKFAMMEDVQGRGMLFKVGDFLNANLWLADIMEDKVILAYKLRGDIRKIPVDIQRK